MHRARAAGGISWPLLVLLCLVGLAIGLIQVRYFGGRSSYRKVTQPVRFNHSKHVQRKEKPLPCESCHRGVKTDKRATLPTVQMCTGCHIKPKGTSEAERHLIEAYVKPGKAIPWQRLYAVPDHVEFSHRTHVTGAKIDCITCHGDMPSRQSPPPRALRVLFMKDCIACHREKKARVDCTGCHH